MSFWSGFNTEEVTGSFDSNPDILPIPKGSQLRAMIEKAEWSEYQGDKYINITWRVLAPEEYANRVLFQKVQVMHSEDRKRIKALNMLANIDKNASGGRMMTLGRTPTDLDLQGLLENKTMMIVVDIYESKKDRGDGVEEVVKVGNWVRSVSPDGSMEAKAGAPAPAKPVQQAPTFDSDIGF